MNQDIYTPHGINHKHDSLPMSNVIGKGDGQGTWDDLQFGLGGAGINTSTGRIGIDPTEHMTFFAANARYPEEPIVISGQTGHGWEWGSNIEFHFHCLQTIDAKPNMLMESRTWANFEQVPETFDKSIVGDWVSDYTGPRFANVYNGFTIDMSRYTSRVVASHDNLSVQFQVVIFRDSANASTLFAGADPYGAQLLVNAFDVHVFNTRTGSRKVYRL